ncbi:hypothetical protein [Helicobacter bizzozeronii]|uniref:DNA methyltransferase n=1 Tax=Helicobacter bizzozeronii (strain CIII-1) TaxID=1002804 RepID=F8KP74_HELBC|nr:hypothetical protein [Helicobacter bizzozeronii]CCB80579.1 hypothetical protein HBZC1_15930 [Helicobacter bizzozeronii CIII-1]
MKMLLLCALLGFTACTPRVVYKDVYIPTRCQISKPSRPSKDLDMLEYLKALLIYTQELEKDLDFCLQK